MSPLPLVVVVAVKVLGVVTPPAEKRSVCNDSNFYHFLGFDRYLHAHKNHFAALLHTNRLFLQFQKEIRESGLFS